MKMPEPIRFRLTRTRLALAGAAAVLMALLAWAFAPRPVQVETAAVTQGRYEQGIEEDGRTRVKDRYTVSAPVTARLARITLHEGDAVQAGDTVAMLTPVMPAMVDERSAREATARLKGAGAGVQRAAARLERARIALEEARLEQQRTTQLAAQGFVSPASLDTARLAVAGAQRELEAASAERDVAVQEQALAAAALQPPGAGARTGTPLAVKSPVSGVVLRVTQPSEASIATGAALLEVGDPARMEVVAQLLTTDAVQAAPGSAVVIERWGGPPVAARVQRVEPAAFTKVSALGVEEQRVNTVIDITSPPPAWRAMGDGFRVGVRIITRSVEQAVLVPVGAVFPHAGGMAVLVLDGRHARLRQVELGGRNGQQAWVRGGLAPGQQVVIYPPPAVTDGTAVRVRTP